MALRNSGPFKFVPVTASDALDTTEITPGAMTALKNLIPDPTTKNLWVARPASILVNRIANSNGITALYVYGDIAFGMANSNTGTFAGFDVPFAYNLLTTNPITITGMTVANLPTTVSLSGDWQPPILSLIGTKIIVTHPGFPNGTSKAGAIDISNSNAPVWSGFDLATQPFPSTPIAVANFFGRAYYLCNPTNGQPSAVFSDVLLPTTRTNASQAITFGDNVPLTAMAPLQLQNQLGGIIQSLIVFKGITNMYQITGDFALTNEPLTVNVINTATGTLAPLSIANTPKGLFFVSPDGFRLIDQNANVSDPVGEGGAGICAPFIATTVPSRICAASNAKTIRTTVKNDLVININARQQEWWLDIARGCWSGPHTFPAAQIESYNKTFIVVPISDPAALYKSDYYQSPSSLFVENGVQLTYNYQTALMPDIGNMQEYNVLEAYLLVAFSSVGDTFNCTVQDQRGQALDAVSLSTGGTASLWGTMVWGTNLWGGTLQALSAMQIPWHLPIVFSRASFSFQGNCNIGVKFGDLHVRVEELGYMKGVTGAP